MLRNATSLLLACLFLGLAGCSTVPKKLWDSRVGNYTYDDAIKELGPPDKSAKLTDGSLVGDWLLFRGAAYSTVYYRRGFVFQTADTTTGPDDFLRLTFDKNNKLTEWKQVYR